MAIQNRIDPWGRLRAVDARGTLLGNRGILHNEHRRIVRHWQRTAWVTCELEFRGRKREVFGPDTYSELFFLDEATAFSAGHRPCAACRRERYDEFRARWLASNGTRLPVTHPSMMEIDKLLHAERAARDGAKVTFEAPVSSLPAGAFVELDGDAFLVWERGLMKWSFAGYSSVRLQPDPSTCVQVLTPESVVRAFRDGLRPGVHSSANG